MNLELSIINLPIEKQYYLLKHFSSIDKKYETKLMNLGQYSKMDIEDMLNTSGSKFNAEFALNPEDLWNKMIKIADYSDFTINETAEKIYLSVNISSFANSPIGTNNLISISDLLENQKKQIFKQKRNNYNALHLIAKGFPTYEITLILSNKPIPKIITIFPGIFAPPFPDKKNQLQTEYNMNNKFWENHVFLIENREKNNNSRDSF